MVTRHCRSSSSDDGTMQFDEFYLTIGTFGRYQKVKYFLICLTYMFPPILVYTWSFTAATPSFRCRTPLDALHQYVPSASQCSAYQKQISVAECQRCFQISNATMQACTSFVFDRTHYQSTLVEEVRRPRPRSAIETREFSSGRWCAIASRCEASCRSSSSSATWSAR